MNKLIEFYRTTAMMRCDCGNTVIMFENCFNSHRWDGDCDKCGERYALRRDKQRGLIVYNVVANEEQNLVEA